MFPLFSQQAVQPTCSIYLHARESIVYHPHKLDIVDAYALFQSSSDLPLLTFIRDIATKLLIPLPPGNPPFTDVAP
jgi:hypothetical protein